MLLLFCDWPAPLSYCSLLWGLHGHVLRTGQGSGLSLFCLLLYGKADLPKKPHVTRDEMKLTFSAFSEFFHGLGCMCVLT